MNAESEERKGLRPVRLALLALGATLVLALLLWLSFPSLLSRGQIADRIQEQVTAMTGYDVAFSPDIDIDFRPVPTVTLHELTLNSPDGSADAPLMRAEAATASIELFSLFTGDPRFTDFKLVRPAFTVNIAPDGSVDWENERGEIARMAQIAAENDRNQAIDAAERPEVVPLPSTSLGPISIEDGTLTIVDRAHDHRETFSALNGRLAWPRLDLGARIEMAAVFRGEPVHFVASTEHMADLVAGNATALRLDFSSELLNASYNGTAGWRNGLMINGEIDLASPSARRALRWSGTQVQPGEAIGALELQANLQVGMGQVMLGDLVLSIDNNRGVGALDITWPNGEKPKISGTLAYTEVDIGAFLRAFAPLSLEPDAVMPDIDTSFLRQLGLDLRLSAQNARLGPVTLTNLAASARIAEGRAIFDLGDASVFGGSILGRVAISEHGFDGGGEIQLSGQNLDFGSIYDTFGITGPVPRAIGSLNLSLATQNPLWATTLSDVTGNIEITMGQGVLPQIDLARFRALSSERRFFSLSEATGGEFGFTRAHLIASFAKGVAEIKEGEIEATDTAIRLSGIVPYYRGSLAMSGLIGSPVSEAEIGLEANSQLRETLEEGPAPLRFFIGGSWPDPVISPIMVAD